VTQPVLDFTAATLARDRAIQRVTQHAEDVVPGFSERAQAFIVDYLRTHGPTPGEQLTIAAKCAGIKSHDDRAMGGVFLSLSRNGLIVKVGSCPRARGHNSSGGNVWDLVR
jgi:hypothetical protein